MSWTVMVVLVTLSICSTAIVIQGINQHKPAAEYCSRCKRELEKINRDLEHSCYE